MTVALALATATPSDVVQRVIAAAQEAGDGAILAKLQRGVASPDDRARGHQIAERALAAERLRRAETAGELPPRSVIGAYPKREQVERWPFAADLDWSATVSAFSGTSHVPEQRAAGTFWDYAAHLLKMREMLGDDFQEYRNGYQTRFNAWLRSRAGVASTMITGRAGFNVRRAEKRSATADNRWAEVDDYHTAFLKRRAREQVAARRAAAGGVVGELRAEIERLERLQAAMKAVNAEIRKLKPVPTNPADIAAAAKGIAERTGISAREVASRLKPDDFGGRGFAAYEMTNNNANIKRKRERLADEEAKAERAAAAGDDFRRTVPVNGGEVDVIYNRDEDRLQLTFSKGLIDSEALRGAALKWSPTRGVWQRQLTDNAVSMVNLLLRKAGAAYPPAPLPYLAQSLAARAPEPAPLSPDAPLSDAEEAAAEADAEALVAEAGLVEPEAEAEAEAAAAEPVPVTPAQVPPLDIEALDITDGRKETLRIARGLGADDDLLILLAEKPRVSRQNSIILPAKHIYPGGKGEGFARLEGSRAGEEDREGVREGGGFRVKRPGDWVVWSKDGLKKETERWTVEQISVGPQVWTIAY